MVEIKIAPGQKIGRLTALEKRYMWVENHTRRRAAWLCKCDCGNTKIIRESSLTDGTTKSCGCLQRELLSKRAGKHYGFGTRLYNIWNSMRQRCNNPNHKAYNNYGGRGIAVCSEWDDYSAFREWAIKQGYDINAKRGVFTLDRIDVNKGYSPSNCRFISMSNQSNNKRKTIIITYNNETHPLKEWADILGMKYCTLWKQYKEGRSIIT